MDFFIFFLWLGEVRERTKHRLVAADEKKKTSTHMLPLSKEARHRPNYPKGLLTLQPNQIKKTSLRCEGKRGKCFVGERRGRAKRLLLTRARDTPSPSSCSRRATNTCTRAHSCIALFALSSSCCLLVVNLTFLPAPVSLKWLVGAGVLVTEAGTGESRSVWLRRTALAQGLINRPSTLPTLSAQAHTSTRARTLATLSPPSSCNKTSQIWRLREAATARPL